MQQSPLASRIPLRMKNLILLAVGIMVGAVLLINVVRVSAAGGDLDTTFNYGSTGLNSYVSAVAVQPDGKILVGGFFQSHNGDAQASDNIARLNANGTLDTTFNYGSGKGANNLVRGIALLPDGKVLIAGGFTQYNGDAQASDGIARLNSDGTLDTTFNYGAGTRGVNEVVYAVAVQPNGKILIAGLFTHYNGDASASDGIARLNSDGTLDTTFNYGAGKGTSSALFAVAVQSDGKILIGGYIQSYNGDVQASDGIARLNTDGTLDTTFNYGAGNGTNGSPVFAVAVQPDGKILIGGGFTTYNGDANASDNIARLNTNGSLDTTFNYGSAGLNSSVSAVAVQPDGRILVGGFFQSYNSDALASDNIARLNTSGTLDTTFNYGAGTRGTNQAVFAVAVQPDGKVLIGGEFSIYNGDAQASDGIARLLPAAGALSFSTSSYSVNEAAGNVTVTVRRTGGTDNTVTAKVTLSDVTTSSLDYGLTPGSLDTSFNYGPGTRGNDGVGRIVLQPDGKILVNGGTNYNGDANASDGVFRLNADGTLDTTFNYGAGKGIDIGGNNGVRAIALQPDGKIIVGGLFSSYNGDANASDNLIRLNADGTLDTSFNYGSGTRGPDYVVQEVAVQPDGKILVVGTINSYNGDQSANNGIMRLNADGSLDTTFNYGFNKGAAGIGLVIAVALQSDGKIVIGGVFNSYDGVVTSTMARLNTDGTLDTSFQGAASDGVYDIIVQPDGKILIGGAFFFYGDGNASQKIARLNSDGTLDTSFNYGPGPDRGARNIVEAIALQPDGKILVGGDLESYNFDSNVSKNIFRLNADGSLDTTFNYGSGKGTDSYVFAIAVQPDGKILIGGAIHSYNGDAQASDGIMRLNGDFFHITWAAGDASDKTIQLPIVDDSQDEINETLTLTLTPLSGGATAGTPSVSTLTIVDNDLTVSQVSGNGVSGSTATLTAKVTDLDIPLSGKTINFSLNGTGVGQATTDATGVATLSNVSLAGITAGTYPNAVGASFPGDATHPSNSSVGPLTIVLPVVQLSNSNYIVGEGAGRAVITITRTGSTSGAISLQYVTSDPSGLTSCNVNTGNASARCDYTAVGGTLSFAAGESSKTFTIPLIDDVYVESSETLTVTLSNATGISLGTQSSATVTITDNDTATGAPNPIDTRAFFVSQLYLDTLQREAEPSGLAAWLNRLNTCPLPGETLQNCDEIEVASAFFRSGEFFDRAYFIYKFYEVAFGRQPQYDEYQRDLRRLTGFLTTEELEVRKREFVAEFMSRQEFRDRYEAITDPLSYVAALDRIAGVTPAIENQLVVEMGNGLKTRAEALRAITESPEVNQKFFNKAFVVVAYFAFLRRNPDIAYLHWINVLNTTGDYREMIRGFMQSAEYRFRFGPAV